MTSFARPSDPQSAPFWSPDSDDTTGNSPRPQHSTTLPSIFEGFGQPPRLSSPRLFPPDWLTLPVPNARTQSFIRPFRDSVNDINRALESANTAIQDAQDAFVLPEGGDIRGNRTMPPIVDLTASSPSQSPEQRRHELIHPARQHNHIMTLLNGLPPGYDPNTHPVPTNRYDTNRLPRIQGFNSDYDVDRSTEPVRRRHRIERHSQRDALGDPFPLYPVNPRLNPQERDQQAIQAQIDARALWNSNQPRREALILRQSRSRSPRRPSPPVRQRLESAVRLASSISLVKSVSSVESIDLTTVDEKASTRDILAKQNQEAVASQRLSSETGRTRLTAYKCPICMETPTDITATVCGHLFCHRCVMESLKWSEEARGENLPHTRPKGVCPVCRKEMRRIDTDDRGRTLVPLNIKVPEQMNKRMKEDIKGKGVARDVPKRESSSDLMDQFMNLDGA